MTIKMFATAIATGGGLFWALSFVIRWIAHNSITALFWGSILFLIFRAVVAWLFRSKTIINTEDPRNAS